MEERKKIQPQKQHYAQNNDLFRFYFHFLNRNYCHFNPVAVKMRSNSSCSTQMYLFPVFEKNALVAITLF